MRLSAGLLTYLTNEHIRVLAAIEVGMRNHEVVPIALIASLSRSPDTRRILGHLAKYCLISRIKQCEGFRLNYAGYDLLALKTFAKRSIVSAVGSQIGVGKESDIYIATSDADASHSSHTVPSTQLVIKFQRLGRASFRSIKKNRDYLRHRHFSSWLYLSKLAADKEFAFMTVLYNHDFPVPKPHSYNRHAIVMEYIDGTPMHAVYELTEPGRVYAELMDLIERMAECGLIHGDFNEFNLILTKDDKIIMIDFPQMVSVRHTNAEMYYERDVEGVKAFFKKRFGYESSLRPPTLSKIKVEKWLDKEVEASGFTHADQVVLERALRDQEDVSDDEEVEDEEIIIEESETSANEQEQNEDEGGQSDIPSGNIPDVSALRLDGSKKLSDKATKPKQPSKPSFSPDTIRQRLKKEQTVRKGAKLNRNAQKSVQAKKTRDAVNSYKDAFWA